MTNPASLSTLDLERAYYLAAYPGATLDPGSISLGQGIKTSSPAPGNYASIAGTGTTAATPGGGTSIVSCTATSTGMYLVQFSGGFGATAESTQLDNIAIEVNTTFKTSIPLANLANTMSSQYSIYLQLNSGDVLSAKVFNNGSTGSIYKAFVSITRVA